MNSHNQANKTTKNNQKENISLKPLQNKRLVDFVLIFRIGIAFAALLSLLFAGGCGGFNWIQESESIVKVAIAENTFILTPEEIAQVRTNVLDKDQNLVLVDYRNDLLCGLSGCLYNIYLKDQKIWSKYLQPDLPLNVDLFAISPNKTANLPCLNVKQYSQINKSLINQTYCFDGNTYTLNQSLS